MSSFLIISIMADDRPGLIETLSSIITEHHGNWLESRMAHLAGKFAGIVRIQISDKQQDPLKQSLQALQAQGWNINIEQDAPQVEKIEQTTQVQLHIVGNDRPGIVKEVAQALACQGVNVLELATHFESAAMSAEALFKTQAKIQLPKQLDVDDVRDQLEKLSNDLMVEVQILNDE